MIAQAARKDCSNIGTCDGSHVWNTFFLGSSRWVTSFGSAMLPSSAGLEKIYVAAKAPGSATPGTEGTLAH